MPSQRGRGVGGPRHYYEVHPYAGAELGGRKAASGLRQLAAMLLLLGTVLMLLAIWAWWSASRG